MKKPLTLLASGLFLLASGQAPTNGLVAYYPFCGNPNDYSGNNLHLTAGGPVLTSDRFNVSGQAYSFDGLNDVLTSNHYGPLNSSSRSVTFWAKTAHSSDGSGQTVLYYGNDQNGFGSRFEVGLNAVCEGPYADVGFGNVAPTFNCSDNQWHHYAMVYDSGVATNLTGVTFYVDGVVVASFCYYYGSTQQISTSTGQGITIGNIHSPYTRFFNGSLDEIRLYDRVLSSAEVNLIKNHNCSCAPEPVVMVGKPLLCTGTSAVYSVMPVAGATYNWLLPNGWTGSSATNTISAIAGAPGTYTLQVTATSTCATSSASLTVTSDVCAGLASETDETEVLIFPNPAEHEITIMCSPGDHITVLDVMGSEKMSLYSEGGRSVLQLDALSQGIYFVKIEGTGSLVIRKVVKE